MQSRCRRQCTEVWNADQSARSAEKNFAFIFQLSGWALVAPSCFALQVPDVKGLMQDRGRHVLPFLAQISLTQRNYYLHVNVRDRGLVPKPFGFSQELQSNGS